ncbi:MAG: hypothetical protein R3D53_08895 [Paracoccaceae bacterium]
MAPDDGLTPMGGYPGNDEDGRALQQQVDWRKLMNDFFAAVEFLMAHGRLSARWGSPALLWRGRGECRRRRLCQDLGAAVLHTAASPTRPMCRCQAPVLLHYAALDERVDTGWPPTRPRSRPPGTTYEAHIYEAQPRLPATTRPALPRRRWFSGQRGADRLVPQIPDREAPRATALAEIRPLSVLEHRPGFT